jgi:hypothetical protein
MLTMFGFFKTAKPSTGSAPIAIQWATNAVDQLQNAEGPLNPDGVFAYFMYFCRTNPGISEVAQFEFGCFVLANVDLWFLANKNDKRQEYFSEIFTRYAQLYTEIFNRSGNVIINNQQISDIIYKRVASYEEIIFSHKLDPSNAIKDLSNVMMCSENKIKPEDYDLQQGPLILDAMKQYSHEMGALLWIKHIFPSLADFFQGITTLDSSN